MSNATLESGNGTALERLENHNELLKSGQGKIAPGQPVRFPEAATIFDVIPQGDLYLIFVGDLETIPAGYTEGPAQAQLVPGQTQGAKHVLENIEGVRMFFPNNWGPESLQGPLFIADRDTTVGHPVHGAVTVPAGMGIECRYQREWDAEQQRQRRNAD